MIAYHRLWVAVAWSAGIAVGVPRRQGHTKTRGEGDIMLRGFGTSTKALRPLSALLPVGAMRVRWTPVLIDSREWLQGLQCPEKCGRIAVGTAVPVVPVVQTVV